MNTNNVSQQIWYPLKEYPNYEISQDGQVRNALSGKVLKAQHRPNGTKYITIKDKKGKTRAPHIDFLVANAFLLHKYKANYNSIKHIDGNLDNCSVDNLVWVEDNTAKNNYHLLSGKTKPDEYFIFYPLMEFPDSMYEINKMGQIRNKKSLKILKGDIRDGYLVYTLLIDKKIVFRSAHIMVAKQFIPNPDNKKIVNHIDENRANPCIDNLEWVTPSENSLHGTAQKRANIGRNKPINEYNIMGKYIRTWKSIKTISGFLDKLYPCANNKSNLQRAVSINSKNVEKVLVANSVFMKYEGNCEDLSCDVKKSRSRAYKNSKLDDIDVPTQYLFDEENETIDYIAELKAIKKTNTRFTYAQKKAIDYAIKCIIEKEHA